MKEKLYVVEGTHDETLLRQIDPNIKTVSVGGSQIKVDVIEFLIKYETQFQVILMFDPDYTGEYIRKKVASFLTNPSHIFIKRDEAYSKNKKKIGVEHLSLEDLKKVLSAEVKQASHIQTITLDSLYKLGLTGQKDSRLKRSYLTDKLKIGHANSKTLIERLNWIGISYEQIEDILNASS